MNGPRAPHEGFMNYSRTIPPRVGGGVGVGDGANAEGSIHPQVVGATRREWMDR